MHYLKTISAKNALSNKIRYNFVSNLVLRECANTALEKAIFR